MISYEIVQLPHDAQTVQSNVERIKAFRLLSLKVSPEAFGSTYAREIAFTQDTWIQRLANPLATTFLAVRDDNIVSSLVVIGPLADDPDKLAPSANPWTATSGAKGTIAYFRINGVFTHPEARGHGIAAALMERAIFFATSHAGILGKELALSIVVGEENTPAKSLYEKSGFITIQEETGSSDHLGTDLLMMYDSKHASKLYSMA
ncbi:hypothetical protein F5884DRAFT_8529 [Xylogone sp. PMI_703]|nr:hypothetical protein F5884DRAFT_8529 [Xylogone sp. PMI_703]